VAVRERLGGIVGIGDALLIGLRQIERETRAVTDVAFDGDVSTRLLGETEDLAEPQPRALADALGREERLEDPVELVGLDPASAIGDRDRDETTLPRDAPGLREYTPRF